MKNVFRIGAIGLICSYCWTGVARADTDFAFDISKALVGRLNPEIPISALRAYEYSVSRSYAGKQYNLEFRVELNIYDNGNLNINIDRSHPLELSQKCNDDIDARILDGADITPFDIRLNVDFSIRKYNCIRIQIPRVKGFRIEVETQEVKTELFGFKGKAVVLLQPTVENGEVNLTVSAVELDDSPSKSLLQFNLKDYVSNVVKSSKVISLPEIVRRVQPALSNYFEVMPSARVLKVGDSGKIEVVILGFASADQIPEIFATWEDLRLQP